MPSESTTETFIAMRLFIDNWRWADVPFISAPASAAQARQRVASNSRTVPHILFNAEPDIPLEPTVLALRVQRRKACRSASPRNCPTEGADLSRQAGIQLQRQLQRNDPEAYERLLLDVMAGDATLFMRRDASRRPGNS